MRWRLLLTVILGLSVWNAHFFSPTASFAEGPPESRGPERTLSPPDPGSPPGLAKPPDPDLYDPGLYDTALFDSSGFVRFQLIQGRLLLDPPRHRQGSQSREEPGIYESITVTARRGLPSLHYICHTDTQQLTLSVQDASTVRIESWLKPTGDRAVLVQPAFGPIVWQTSRGELSNEFKATTLLHLRHQDPIGFDQHIELLISRVLRGRSLRELARQTHRQMLLQTVRSTAAGEMPQLADIEKHVADLASTQQSTRVGAERQLLTWGTVALPLIQSLESMDWDAEQRHRLRRIVGRLRPRVDDSPATLALLLMNDRDYWSALAKSMPSDQLASVNSHLGSVGLASVSAPENSAERIARLPK